MPALVDIRRRIRSVKNTQQITKAMKMVSAAKLRRAQDAMFAARPYARKMMEVLSSMASRAEKKDIKGELTDKLKAALEEFAGVFQAEPVEKAS